MSTTASVTRRVTTIYCKTKDRQGQGEVTSGLEISEGIKRNESARRPRPDRGPRVPALLRHGPAQRATHPHHAGAVGGLPVIPADPAGRRGEGEGGAAAGAPQVHPQRRGHRDERAGREVGQGEPLGLRHQGDAQGPELQHRDERDAPPLGRRDAAGPRHRAGLAGARAAGLGSRLLKTAHLRRWNA